MTSKERLASADMVVIGAGVMGASIAFHLSRRTDKRILVVDQSPPLGGMSGRTFGQIRLHYSNALLLEMAQHGVRFFENWADEVGWGNAGYHRMGYLLIVVEQQLEALQRNVELAQGLGIDTSFVDPDQIKRIEPAIDTTGLVGGAFDPAGGYIDVTRIVLSLLMAAQARGVEVMPGVRADGIETKNGRVTGVGTARGTIQAPVVISACGPWARELLQPLEIAVPIEARRLDTMYLRQPPGGAQIGCCITDGNSNVAIRPDMGRDILAAAYPKEMPLAKDPAEGGSETADAEHLVRVRNALAERLPGLAEAQPARSVSGTYDITPDWHPILGFAPGVDGLLLATGFSGHGLKLAPAVGDVIASMALGKGPSFDVRPLRFERFADDEPMYLAYGPGGRA